MDGRRTGWTPSPTIVKQSALSADIPEIFGAETSDCGLSLQKGRQWYEGMEKREEAPMQAWRVWYLTTANIRHTAEAAKRTTVEQMTDDTNCCLMTARTTHGRLAAWYDTIIVRVRIGPASWGRWSGTGSIRKIGGVVGGGGCSHNWTIPSLRCLDDGRAFPSWRTRMVFAPALQ